MSDAQFLRIDANWALACDDRQWVLQRFRGVRRKGERAGEEKWDGVSFVAYSKASLARCMREKGVPLAAAEPVLASLPETFPEFRAQRRGEMPGVLGRTRVEPREAPEPTPPLRGPLSGLSVARVLSCI
jgi:hypothetical protein